MRLLSDLKRALKGTSSLRTVEDIAKARNGLYVSRPVLNGQEWHDWAVKWKVPNPVAAADMHVTVLYSTVPVLKVPRDDGMTVPTEGYGGGVFAFFGPNDESLVFTWDDYCLWSRNWEFICSGAVTTWPTYRPHLAISKDAKDFDLPNEALADAPKFISLGGEVYADLKLQPADDPSEVDQDGDDDLDDDEDDTLIVVIALAAQEAAKRLENPEGLTALDRLALRDIAVQKSITRGVASRISKAGWATDGLKALAPAEMARQIALQLQPAETRKSAEVTIAVRQITAEVAKKMGPLAKAAATDSEKRIVTGIASVSTIDGDLIKDSDGHEITTEALHEFIEDLFRSQRAGKFEHEGDPVNEIVQGMVIDKDLQDCLGIDLGMEFLLIRTHVPGDDDWARVKAGIWMQSIAGLMYYEDV